MILVVTDLVLEGEVSGIGLINLIRQGNERIRDIPILAVSGWNDLLRQVYVLKHGAGDFIAKPFNGNRLFSTSHQPNYGQTRT